MSTFAKPENALKRAEELINVGQKQAALQALHDLITSKRYRSWQKPLEKIMMKYVELCVDLRKGRFAKDGLIQYRIVCQQVNVSSLEEVIKHFMQLSNEKAEEAKAQAQALEDALDVEDLEADKRPEDLMLSYVSGEKGTDRSDREFVTPWFKFLWETYRTVLEILRNNSKLEALYAMTAHKAFQFCKQYKRSTEFRRLCEIIRNHLANLNKYRDQRDRPDLTAPESCKLYLDTRVEQLKIATELSLWQEAFRSVEDIHGLMSLVKRTPKPSVLVVYYAKLTEIFWISESHLYHAYAWLKLFNLQKSYNKNLNQKDLQLLASSVLLAALSVTPYDNKYGASHLELENEKERSLRMANLVNFSLDSKRENREMASRASLLAELAAKGVISCASPEVKDLYNLMENEFLPLDLASKVQPLLSKISTIGGKLSAASSVPEIQLSKYQSSLEKLTALRVLQQASQIFQSMKIDMLSRMIPFFEFSVVEKIAVDAVKHNFVAMKVNHLSGAVHFGNMDIESDGLGSHLSVLADSLNKARCLIHPPVHKPSKLGENLISLTGVVEKEHKKLLARKSIIEKRKEDHERQILEKEKEEETKRLSIQKKSAEEERERLSKEQRLREKQRIQREIEQKDQKEAQLLLLNTDKPQHMKKGKKHVIEGEITKQGALERLMLLKKKERDEMERKLQTLAKKMDHLERAKRQEEAPLIEEAFQKRLEGNILTYGDISPDKISSASDKAHLRLAAAKAVLRLSRQWDHKVPVDVFYLTLRISQDDFPQMRKLFLSKVQQYIKERALDAKYACAFLIGMDDYRTPQYEEFKHNLIEVAQICQQVKMRQLSVQADINLVTAYPEYIIPHLVHVLAHDPSCPSIDDYEDVKAFGPIYWRLYLLLSTLLGEEGLQYSAPGMKKESFMTTLSIFRSIKFSKDVVDANKTKTLHAICDLGILLAKKLCPDEINISDSQTVPLPPQLYVPVQNDQNENSVVNNEQKWSGCESVLAHFEALMAENIAEVESPEDKMLIDETDEFGNEIPLGKIVQILKSRAAKKAGRKQKAASDSVNTGKDDDVLGLLREINLDNQENLEESVKSKPKKRQMDVKESNEKPVDFSTPKRKRSASKSRPHSAKGSKDSDEPLVHSVSIEKTNNSENKLKKKSRTDSTDTDLVASPINTRTPVSKGKNVDKKSHTEVSSSSGKSANENSTRRTADLANLNGSYKRQKPRLVSGLAKCSTHDSSSKDLVGQRIKVWWPLDKAFYEGVVKSYDVAKKLHTVLYNDGDIEQLNMAKEKWKRVESNGSPIKQQKKDLLGTNQGRAQEARTTSSPKAPPNQHKPIKKSSPLKRKVKPKSPLENKHRKTAGGSKSVEANDSDAAGSLAHPDSNEDVNSDGHEEKEVAVSSAEKEKTEKESKGDVELKEEKPDGNSVSSKEESDDETLSVWRKRASQAT